jgi:uncharacterized oligopeptide transporter (OPT) family protein
LVGGFPILAALLVSVFLVFIGFILHAITLKIAAEAGLGPTIGMLLISILILFILLQPISFLFSDPNKVALLVLVGTTAFAVGMVGPVTVMWDHKCGHYIGTRPFHLFKGQSIGLLVGIPICAVFASILSRELATGNLVLPAPHAHAYSTFILILFGGKTYASLIILGIFCGIFVELISGKGTIFGLGMFFPIGFPLMLFIGGYSRERWEKRIDKEIKRKRLSTDARSIKILDSYMIMTGIFVGEAIAGLVLTLSLILP